MVSTNKLDCTLYTILLYAPVRAGCGDACHPYYPTDACGIRSLALSQVLFVWRLARIRTWRRMYLREAPPPTYIRTCGLSRSRPAKACTRTGRGYAFQSTRGMGHVLTCRCQAEANSRANRLGTMCPKLGCTATRRPGMRGRGKASAPAGAPWQANDDHRHRRIEGRLGQEPS